MTPSDPKLRQRARNKVQTAIRAGRLTRPSQCEECGRLGNPDAHHPDYTRPLAVEWLCAWCHRARHPSLPGISQRKKPITIQLEPDLIEEIDRAAKHIETSRQEWIAAACRSALTDERDPIILYKSPADDSMATDGPTLARMNLKSLENVRSSSQAKRNTQPYPKKGKST